MDFGRKTHSTMRHTRYKMQLHAAISETSNQAIMLLHPDGSIYHCNDAAKALLGVQQLMDAQPTTDFLHHPMYEILQTVAIPTASEIGFWHGEFTLSVNGSKTEYMIAVIANHDETGSIKYFTVIIRDLFRQKYRYDKERLASNVLDHIIEGVVITDADSKIVNVNRAFTNVTGYEEHEVIGKKPNILSSGRHDKAFYEAMWKDLLELGFWKGEVWNRHKNGKIYLQKLTISAIKNEQGVTEFYVSLIEDITQKREMEEKIAFHAHHDSLTLLPNRYSFQKALEKELQIEDNKVFLLLLDLDRFKRINDSLGHHVGDQLLCAVGERLVQTMDDVGTVYRLSGDEFIILCTNVVEQEILRKADAVLEELRRPFYIEGNQFFIGGSIGISQYPEHGKTIGELLKCADMAMYRAKELGRNNVQVFQGASHKHSSKELLELENSLHLALEQDQFELYFQPQLELTSGNVTGVEVLVRWNHPEKGIIPPIHFIPIAEDSGLILRLDDLVLYKACKQAVAWAQKGYPPLRISVNLSVLNFNKRDLVERIFTILKETGMDPRLLVIELTESAVMNNPDVAYQVLSELQSVGISISLDDFGTGYSSLGYLRKLPIHCLKIDRSFIRDITEDEGSTALVRSIIQLALNLKLSVVAEGIETSNQLELIRNYGCNKAQGYLISKPIREHELEQLILHRYH